MDLRVYRKLGRSVSDRIVATGIMLICFSHVTFWYDSYEKGQTTSLVLLITVIGIAGLYGISSLKDIRPFFASGFSRWALAALVIYVLNLARLSFGDAPIDDLDDASSRVQLFLPAFAFAYLAYRIPGRYFKFGIGIVALIAPLSLVFDFANPDLMHPFAKETNQATSARVSSFWLNPNAAGEAVLLGVILCSHWHSKKFLAIVYSVAGLGIILTGSRSGIAAYVLIGAYLIFHNYLSRWYMVVPIIAAFSFTSLLTTFEDTAQSLGRDQGIEDSLNRINVLSGDSESDNSSEIRNEVAEVSLDFALETPIFGHGYQFVDPIYKVGTHNLPLHLAFQYGLFGLAIWIGLLYVLFKIPTPHRLPSMAFFMFLWFSFFSHNLLEPNTWFVFIALMIFAQPNAERAPQYQRETANKTRKKRGQNTIADGKRRARKRYRF